MVTPFLATKRCLIGMDTSYVSRDSNIQANLTDCVVVSSKKMTDLILHLLEHDNALLFIIKKL